ncbi:MAG: penicillin-binding protein activator [Gammaproteobacteria bacterium]|nr:penicillin-binding protein activator [Gammaproteobacteria bacterium]
MCKIPRTGCLLALVAIFAMSGCKSTPEQSAPAPERTAPNPASVIEADLRQAEGTRDNVRQARDYLQSLERLLELGEAERVEQAVRRMLAEKPGELTLAEALDPVSRYRFDAIRLDMALAAADKAEIHRLLATLDPQGVEQTRHSTSLRARALAAIGDIAESARVLIALADTATDPATLDGLSTAIWRNLTQLPALELRSRAEAASTPTARAWWMLASHFNEAVTSRGQINQWQRWRNRHPDHPAARHPPPSLGRFTRDPGQLALLVPVTGDFGAAGEAVRDGFLAAYLHAGGNSQRVAIYDTNTMSVRAAYDLARQQGAEVIVGPLQREAVTAFAALSPTLPAIVLNHLDPDTAAPDTMIQFSLAIEDQASAIAEALAEEEIERIVLFDSPARWSGRARARLEDELDGVEAVGFGTFHRLAEITDIVGRALHISESQTRVREIESLLGRTLEFAPRRRDDVDAVVALIDADEFLSLMPALDFHFAGDLPVFAPSTATLGTVDLSRLEGLRICAMPWTLDAGTLGETVNNAFPASRGSYASLFALGVDGFRLANQLDRLTVQRQVIPGSTGVLSLGEDGRIRRSLVWAQVIGGRLVPMWDAAN